MLGIPLAALLAFLSSDSPTPAQIQVPPGFVIERVAESPLVERPMMVALDDRGRLFVCDSSGFNLTSGTSEILIKDPPHMIRVLADTDGDGRYDQSQVFADKMTFPMGALWHDGALYTASSPHLWRLLEGQNTGIAVQRQVFVEKFEFAGNGCDIHGPFLGPDGVIYWANCQRKFAIPRQEGGMLQGKAAGVFRIRTDGSQVEMLCAGGMDNPVEVAFTEEGEALATVDLLIGGARPRADGIIHCIEGGLFPYQKLDRSFHRTGDVLPPVIDLGWVAPAGLMKYRDDAWGSEYNGNLFTAHFNTHRVVRHIIERDGATFRGRSEDFLVSNDPDFHPTDIIQDADGSLLVVDTGGWFLRGCPTSQIAKPDIKGAIYRVRRKDTPLVSDPRGLLIDWSRKRPHELVKLLDDPRWFVRDRAIEVLSKLGDNGVKNLEESIRRESSAMTRRNAVWALHRMSSVSAREAIRVAMADPDNSVRLTATTSAAQWRDAGSLESLKRLAISDPMPAVQREAATGLGRIGHVSAVSVLLTALRQGGDRFLEHAQIYGLIRIGGRDATLPGLRDPDPRVQRAALLAIDQMEQGELTREQFIPLLTSSDPELQRTTLSIAAARPEWADAVASVLLAWILDSKLTDSQRAILKGTLIALSDQTAIQELVNRGLADDGPSPIAVANQLVLLETIAQATVKRPPQSWIATLTRILDRAQDPGTDKNADERVLHQAVVTIQSQDWSDFDDSLLRLGRREQHSQELRLAALGTIASRLKSLDSSLLEFLSRQLDNEQPLLVRVSAASAISRLPLDDQQLSSLIPAVAAAGMVELPYLLVPYERSKSTSLGFELVQAIERSPGFEGLSPESLRQRLKSFPDDVQQRVERLIQRLSANVEQQTSRLKELEPALAGGNPLQGRIVFFGKKAACAACHTVGGQGTAIGPDLTKIGAIRTPRDLLESIVFPSASIVRSFEPYSVVTSTGQIHNGLMKNNSADAVTLITMERTEVRLPKSGIEEIQPSRVSIMPKGLDSQLSLQELTDLIAYLVNRR